MPSAAAAAPPPVFEAVLARLRADASAHFGTPTVRLRPAAHEERPFSHVLRVEVSRHEGDPAASVFVKIFKPKPHDGGVQKMRGRVVHDFEVTRRIHDAMASSSEDLGTVRPIACYPDELAIVTEQAEGETLSSYVRNTARWFSAGAGRGDVAATFSRVGSWLRPFQQIDPANRRIEHAELRAYVDIRLQRLVSHGVFTSGERGAILEYLDTMAARTALEAFRDVLVHADFALGNILVHRARVTVLDLAMVQRGCALHDITRLYLQLDALHANPQFRPAIVHEAQRALLHGYDDQLSAAEPMFRYLLMLHRINNLATLSFMRERFPASALSRRVRRRHRRWIAQELRSVNSAAGV